jgi:hypothetical protein
MCYLLQTNLVAALTAGGATERAMQVQSVEQDTVSHELLYNTATATALSGDVCGAVSLLEQAEAECRAQLTAEGFTEVSDICTIIIDLIDTTLQLPVLCLVMFDRCCKLKLSLSLSSLSTTSKQCYHRNWSIYQLLLLRVSVSNTTCACIKAYVPTCGSSTICLN